MKKLPTWFEFFFKIADQKSLKLLTIFPGFPTAVQDHSQMFVNASVYLIY